MIVNIQVRAFSSNKLQLFSYTILEDYLSKGETASFRQPGCHQGCVGEMEKSGSGKKQNKTKKNSEAGPQPVNSFAVAFFAKKRQRRRLTDKLRERERERAGGGGQRKREGGRERQTDRQRQT